MRRLLAGRDGTFARRDAKCLLVHRSGARRTPGIRAILAAYIPLLVGCETAREPVPVGSTATWVVAGEPTIRVGGEESDEAPLYRVAGATRITSGYLIVNRSADELRLYDLQGTFQGIVGREGSGPGEFQYPQIVGRLRGDSVAVYDSRNSRLSIICAGTYVCTEIPMRGFGRVVGAGHDHVVLGQVSGGPLSTPGVHRRPYTLSVFDRATGNVDTLAVIEGQPTQVGGQDNSMVVMAVPMTRPPQVSAVQDVVFLANGRDPQIDVWMLSGRHLGIVPLPIDLDPVSDSEFRSTAGRILNSGPDIPGLSRMIEAMEPPPFRPPIRRLLADRTGLVWVELDQGQPERHDWLVADTAGNVRARVTTPVDVSLLEIGENYVIGLWRDTLEVEYVQVHRLERR